MAPHPDLEAEQAFVDHAYRRLEAMRAGASAMLHDAFSSAGGTPQALTERDVSVRNSLARLEQLQLGEEALVFGRIDTADGPDASESRDGPDLATRHGPEGSARLDGPAGEAFHIGRLAVSDSDQEPLVVDWRAPVAEPFYRATGRHPMGLRRRRHFHTYGRRVNDLEDELFGGDGPDAVVGAGGSTVLLAALERARSGRMRDIVATVQREQDQIIRAPLPGVLVVQGGPGTGKTAVALHRAAYLLYTFRFPLERQGVLVVGPNPLYLRYIGHVLPSLGESGVELSTIGGLVHGVTAAGADDPLAARIKGDARMAKVVATAVSDRQRRLPRDVLVGVGPHVLRFTVRDSADVVTAAKRRTGSHNGRRRLVEALVARKLARRLERAEERSRRAGFRAALDDEPAEPRDETELARRLRRDPVVAAALDRMWPVLSSEELLHDLFGAGPLLDLAGRPFLADDERAALIRPRSASLEQVAWTDADLALLDEARSLLGPPTRRPPSRDDDGIRAFGHVVVDEAQDLSPMQLRMLARRSINGSMSVVGDIAQATGPVAPATWDDVLEHLPTQRGVSEVELTVNYRTPEEIMVVAGRVLEVAAPHLRLPESVRATGDEPQIIASRADRLVETVARVATAESAAVAGGTVAVIAAPRQLDEVAAGLDAAGVAYEVGVGSGLGTPVTLLPVDVVKGLEFDGVVVVEPARLAHDAPQGLRALYVALTRATKRLAVVHAAPLPVPLD